MTYDGKPPTRKRRPPETHQWRPGQSGNPRGRPKNVDNLFEHSAKMLSEPLRVKIDGKKAVEYSLMEAVILSFAKKALKGSPATFFSLMTHVLRILPAQYSADQKVKRDGRKARQKLAEVMGITLKDENTD